MQVGPVAFQHASALGEYARKLIARSGKMRVLDRGRNQCAIVSVMIPGRDTSEIKLALRRRGVNTSVSARQSGVIDMDRKGASTLLRISPRYYNTEQEIERAVEILVEVSGKATQLG